MGDLRRVGMVIQRFRPNFSGQGIQVEALASTLARRGLEITILTSTEGTGASVESCDGYQVVRLGSEAPKLVPSRFKARGIGPTFAARVFSYLQRHEAFDVIHVHAMTDALYSSYAWCRLHDRPIVFELTLIGADDPASVARSANRLARVRYALYRRCDGYVAISPALAEACHRVGMPHDRVRLIPQAVDTRTFSPVRDRHGLRRELDLPSTGQLVVFVGSLIRRKGIDLLLQSWSRLCRQEVDAHLLLVGRNEFGADRGAADFLSDQFARLAPEARKRVHVLGVRDDVHRLMQASDLFVFPSRREGFGTVMAEAMACGLPSVVSQLPGITDFIFAEGGRTGVVVPQDNVRMLTREVGELLSDRARSVRVGHAARRDALERFDIETIADEYIRYYERLRDAGARRGEA